MKLRIVFEEDEDGWFTVHCPDLPGCVSQGKGMDDAKTNIKEAIEGYLEVVLEDALAENLKKFREREKTGQRSLVNGHLDAHYRLEAIV